MRLTRVDIVSGVAAFLSAAAVVAALLVAFMILVLLGAALEQKRIRNKCLESNSTMAYNEAVAKCDKLVGL